jgi:hypothetical protein
MDTVETGADNSAAETPTTETTLDTTQTEAEAATTETAPAAAPAATAAPVAAEDVAQEAEGEAARLLSYIETESKALLSLIESIPDGVVHGWHSLAAEIRSRV